MSDDTMNSIPDSNTATNLASDQQNEPSAKTQSSSPLADIKIAPIEMKIEFSLEQSSSKKPQSSKSNKQSEEE